MPTTCLLLGLRQLFPNFLQIGKEDPLESHYIVEHPRSDLFNLFRIDVY